ncbi:MAG: hypothetical protein H6993_00145 [Pseudomonadales bacterium]|nr:hypothetical protein [Pseudomonadales bacterium]MCP5182332.1 hypothetical protein [Pseudomonadales bacterium]
MSYCHAFRLLSLVVCLLPLHSPARASEPVDPVKAAIGGAVGGAIGGAAGAELGGRDGAIVGAAAGAAIGVAVATRDTTEAHPKVDTPTRVVIVESVPEHRRHKGKRNTCPPGLQRQGRCGHDHH